LRIRAQQKLLVDETEKLRDQERQLQQQQLLEDQHLRQQSEYQFEVYDNNAQQQQVSTPIQNSSLKPGCFDRENPFRRSSNLGENLQKPTPDDKMKYFARKQQTAGGGDMRQGERIEKKLDMEEISAIESSDTEKEINAEEMASEKLKRMYSKVKKTTPRGDEKASFKERITKFENRYEER
jgi:hypothetical protein